MKNDTIRVHANQGQLPTKPEYNGSGRLAVSQLPSWSSYSDETYDDGYIDYTHEL